MGDGLRGSVNEIWAISDLDLDNVTPKWEVGYATLKSEVNADALAVALCHAQTMRTATSIGGQLRYSKGRLKQVAKTNTVLES